ncbi:MAG: GAF domain-containing protein [Candidatus Neomarinimicrobiota bacterium]|nr:GAF domain-containing protein [Candidatus Neomarinimicrobiota bacterium]
MLYPSTEDNISPNAVVAVLGKPETIIAFLEYLLFFDMGKLQSEIKETIYQEAIFKIKKFENEINLDRISNVLYHMFENWNFCGFYVKKGEQLEISSYKSDKIPCSPINMDGVCGKSIISKDTIIVPNVNEFAGHIECDPNSKSEIAIPFSNYVFDIDSKEFDDFDEIDEKYLKKIIDMI